MTFLSKVLLSVRRRVLVLLFALLLISSSSCVSTNVGKSRYPCPTEGFQPKKEYGVSAGQMWDRVKNVLAEERITIASSDKAEGRIATDYIEGESKLFIGLGTASYTTRYKYNIDIDTTGDGKTLLNIICTLESSETGSGRWINVNKEHPDIVKALENWLYEKIESKL